MDKAIEGPVEGTGTVARREPKNTGLVDRDGKDIDDVPIEVIDHGTTRPPLGTRFYESPVSTADDAPRIPNRQISPPSEAEESDAEIGLDITQLAQKTREALVNGAGAAARVARKIYRQVVKPPQTQ